jgi:uncharacterized Rmd1/YagE family protein
MSAYKLRPDWRDVLTKIIETGWCEGCVCVDSGKACPFSKVLTGVDCINRRSTLKENKQRAKQRMEELEMQETTPKSTDSPNGLKRGDPCRVSDISEEDARSRETGTIFLGYYEEVNEPYRNVVLYPSGIIVYWRFAILNEEKSVTELTIAEIAKKLGIPTDKLRIKE